MSDFLNSLIGKPYEVGAVGPDSYDCWGLAQVIQRELFGREMPDIKSPPKSLKSLIHYVRDHDARKQWKAAEKFPIHGQLVEMTQSEHPFHIGVYLEYDGGGIIHSFNPAGVCFDRPAVLRLAGWRGMIFHDWAD